MEVGDLRLSVTLTEVPKLSPVSVRMDQAVCGKSRIPNSLTIGRHGEVLDVVVWVEGARVLGWPTSDSNDSQATGDSGPTLYLRNCEIQPPVLMTQPKESVRIINQDPVLHSLRAQGKKNFPVFRAHPPNLAVSLMRFDEPEIVPIYSDTHPWMKAFVVVAPHQNYAITDQEGRATIKSIPLGKVKLKLWHAILGQFEFPREIEIQMRNETIAIEWPKSQP